MAEVIDTVRKAARGNANILILGESGTGKELIARAIHDLSPRAQAPFHAVNLSALPESLIESELFGHVKGAFTGASGERDGHFVAANRGSLFLDEIGEVPPHIQVKLLRVIEMREAMRVGESRSTPFDVRLIFATNRKLSDRIREGHFREDFFFRISTIVVELPPLRKREGDIPLLIGYFLRKYAAEARLSMPPTLSYNALRALCTYDWPGNFRELQNVIERLVALHGEDGEIGLQVTEKALNCDEVLGCEKSSSDAHRVRGALTDIVLHDRADWAQCLHQMEVFRAAGNISEAARRLGIARKTFRERMERWSARGWVVGNGGRAEMAE